MFSLLYGIRLLLKGIYLFINLASSIIDMSGLEEVVSETLGFRLATDEGGITLFDEGIDFSESGQDVLNLLSIANISGYFAASNQNKIIIDEISKLRSHPEGEWRQVNGLEGVTQLHFNSDETTLYILQNGVLKYINITKYIQGEDGGVEILEESKSLVDIKSVLPSPIVPKALCVLTSSDELHLINSNGSKSISRGITSFKWSYDGERIYCSDAKNVAVTNNEGSELFKIPTTSNTSEDFSVEENDIVFVAEIQTNEIFVVFDKSDADVDDHDIRSFFVKKSSTSYEWYETDIAPPYGSAARITNYYHQSLVGWTQKGSLQFITSGLSTDIGIFCIDNGSITIVTQSEDTDRAQFPIDDDTGEDYSPVGFAVDLTASDITVKEPCSGIEEATGKLPCIWALCHTGKLVGWWVFDKDGLQNNTLTLSKSLAKLKENKNKVNGMTPTFKGDKNVSKQDDVLNNDINALDISAKGSDTRASEPNEKDIFDTSNIPSRSANEIEGSSVSKSEPNSTLAFSSSGFGSNNSTLSGSEQSGFGQSGFGSKAGGFGSAFGQTAFKKEETGNKTEESTKSPGFGSSGFGQSGFGQSGFSSNIKPSTGFGQGGFGSNTKTSTGFGSSGFGSSGFGSNTKSSTGFGQSGFGSKTPSSGGFGQSSFGFGSHFGKQEESSKKSPFGSIKASEKGESPFSTISASSDSPFAKAFDKPTNSIFGEPKSNETKTSNSTEDSKENFFDGPSGVGLPYDDKKSESSFPSEEKPASIDEPLSETNFTALIEEESNNTTLGTIVSQDNSFGNSISNKEPIFGNFKEKDEEPLGFSNKNEDPSKKFIDESAESETILPELSSSNGELVEGNKERSTCSTIKNLPIDTEKEILNISEKLSTENITEGNDNRNVEATTAKPSDSILNKANIISISPTTSTETKSLEEPTAEENEHSHTIENETANLGYEVSQSDLCSPGFEITNFEKNKNKNYISNSSSESILSYDTEDSIEKDTISLLKKNPPPNPANYFIYDGLSSPLQKIDNQIEWKIQDIYNDTTGYLSILNKNVKELINYIDQQSEDIQIDDIQEALDYSSLWRLSLAKDLDAILSTLSPDIKDILKMARSQESKLKKLTEAIESNQSSRVVIDKLLSHLAILSDSSALISSKDRSLDLQNELLQTSLRQKLHIVRRLEKELIAKLMPLKAKLSNNDKMVKNLEKVVYQINATLHHKVDSIDRLSKEIEQLSIENEPSSKHTSDNNSKIDISNITKWKFSSIYDSKQVIPKKISL